MKQDNLSNFLKGISSNYGSATDIHFVRPGFYKLPKTLDSKGEEIGIGYASPTELQSRSFKLRGDKISVSERSSSSIALGKHYSDVLSETRGLGDSKVKNLVFAYDPQLTERLGYLASNKSHADVPFGTNIGVGPDIFQHESQDTFIRKRAPIVNVKQLLNQTFPELQEADSTIESMAKGLNINFMTTSGGTMDPEEGPRVLRQMVKKAYAKDPSAVSKAIAASGFGGTSIVDPTDPHNIASYMGSINKISAISDRGAGSAIHIQGRQNLGKFTRQLGTTFGRDYADIVSSFAEDVFANTDDPDRVAFLLTKDRRVFIGMSGSPSQYHEIPGQMGSVISMRGKLSSARSIVSEGKITSVAKRYLDEFREGMGGYGRGFANLGAALEKGRIQARKEPLAFGYSMSEMLDPSTAMGKTSLHSAMFDRLTVLGSRDSMSKTFKDTLTFEGIFKAGKDQNISGLTDKLSESLLGDFDHMNGITGVDPSAYLYVKAKQNKGIYPTAGLHGLSFPGTYTEKIYTKGLYQIRGRAEVTSGSAIRRIIQSRAALGIGGPSPVAVAPMAMKIERRLSVAHSKLRNRKSTRALVELNSLIGVVGGSGSTMELLFGDTGAVRTQSGGKLLAKRHTLKRTNAAFGKADVSTMLTELLGSGRHADEIIRQAQSGQVVNLQDAIPFSQRRARRVNALWKETVPRGAAALAGIEWNRRSQTFDISYLTKELPGEWSSILANNTRITAQAMSKERLTKTFGDLAAKTDIIINQATAASMGSTNIKYRHMLGLAGMQKDGTSKFLELYRKQGGKGLSLTGSGRITYGKGFDMSEFLTIGEKSLQQMNFSMGQIHGLMYASEEFGPGVGSLVKGESGSIGDLGKIIAFNKISLEDLRSGNMANGMFAFLGAIAQREGADLDLGKAPGAFKMKIQSLYLMSQSVKEMYGLNSIEDHPVYQRVINHFENSTGIKLNTHAMAPHNFVKSFPDELKHLTGALRGPAPGRDVLSRSAAAKQFVYSAGGMKSSILNKDSTATIDDIYNSNLLKPGRKGFYLDMGDNFQLPVGNPNKDFLKRGVSRQASSRYIYIPGSETMKRMLGEGMPSKDSYLGHILNILQQPSSLSGQKGGGSPVDINTAFYRAWSFISSASASGNLMRDTIFSSTALPGSVRGRILNAEMSVSNVLKGASNRYNVEIGEHTVRHLASTLAKDLNKPFKEVYEELLARAKAGNLYGSVTPRPQHAGSHMQVVSMSLGQDIGGEIPGKHYVKMHAYHAFTQNRDLDKDTIELMALHPSQYKNDAQMKGLIEKQTKHSDKRYAAWKRNKDQLAKTSELVKGLDPKNPAYMKRLTELSLPYFGFGQTPALSYMGSYANMAVAGQIAEESTTAIEAAERLNRIAGDSILSRFEGEDIQRLRNLYSQYADNNLKGSFSRAIELQRNVLQGTIAKGGEGLKTVIEDYLNIPYEISQQLGKINEKQAMEMATDKVRTFLINLAELTPGLTEDERIANIFYKIQGGFGYHGSSEQILNKMAKDLGAMAGISAIAQYMTGNQAKLKSGHSIPDMMRNALGKKLGSLQSLWAWINGGSASEIKTEVRDSLRHGINREMITELDKAGAEIAEEATANAAKKAKGLFASSQVLEEMSTKLATHWKLVAGIAGGLVALRAMSGLASPAPVPRDPFLANPAPVPRDPLISLPEEGALFPTQNNYAYMIPNQGHTSNINASASYSSESMSSDILNRRNSFNTVQIADSRSYRSNFEMYQMQKRKSSGDFSHQYQS